MELIYGLETLILLKLVMIFYKIKKRHWEQSKIKLF